MRNEKDFVHPVFSSFISSLTNTAAKTTVMTNRTMPTRGFITSQFMIGVITYAVIKYTEKITNTATIKGYEIALWRTDTNEKVVTINGEI